MPLKRLLGNWQGFLLWYGSWVVQDVGSLRLRAQACGQQLVSFQVQVSVDAMSAQVSKRSDSPRRFRRFHEADWHSSGWLLGP